MKQYIAVCLAGIFSYSFLFQSLHIMHHHGHLDCGQVCGTDHRYAEQEGGSSTATAEQAAGSSPEQRAGSSATDPDGSTTFSATNPDGSTTFSAADPDGRPCLICDFKFPVNELPVDHEPGVVAHQFVELRSNARVAFLPERGYSQTQPRAPPVTVYRSHPYAPTAMA